MFESGLSPKKREEERKKQEHKEYLRKNQESIEKRLRDQSQRVIEEAEEKIGKGNSARVFVDQDKPDICYKVIYRGMGVNTPKEEKDLLEESRNIISERARVPDPIQELVFDYEKDGKKLRCSAFAMERVDGMTLEEVMEQRRFPEGMEPESMDDYKVMRDTFREVRELVERLNAELGIYHRDIRTRNIMLDKDGVWWVIDFGKAKKEYFENEPQSGDVRDVNEVWNSFLEFLGPYIKDLKS